MLCAKRRYGALFMNQAWILLRVVTVRAISNFKRTLAQDYVAQTRQDHSKRRGQKRGGTIVHGRVEGDQGVQGAKSWYSEFPPKEAGRKVSTGASLALAPSKPTKTM